jgi:hypothetical protein
VSTATRRALYGKLTSDGTLLSQLGAAAPGYTQSIYYQSAPDTASFPLVVFSKQSGLPTEAFADPTALDTEVWLVKGVAHQGGDTPGQPPAKSAADIAEAIGERIRTLMNDGALSIAGTATATQLYLRRQSDVDYAELSAGEIYAHSGSLFRLAYDP